MIPATEQAAYVQNARVYGRAHCIATPMHTDGVTTLSHDLICHHVIVAHSVTNCVTSVRHFLLVAH